MLIFRELIFLRLGESFDTCIVNFANFISQMDLTAKIHDREHFQSYGMPLPQHNLNYDSTIESGYINLVLFRTLFNFVCCRPYEN